MELYTLCTREWCNRLGRTPIYRDFRVNHIFRYGQRENFDHFLATGMFVFLHSQEHTMQGMMV